MNYDHNFVENKWRKYWEKNPINDDTSKKKYYCLDMFPYPSGSGLHVGHWRGYVLSDVWSRYKLLQGYHVLHPMGWDAFGLPAENYAIEKGIHPKEATDKNIQTFKRQLKEISAIYDWDKEINTTDPNFYKWTQWIFIQMFKKGLAYEKEMPINWCPSCKTGLANEEVKDGHCDRCDAKVTKKNLRQWMLKITAYADRLLDDLDGLDWPKKVKKMQAEWIGRSHGAQVVFKTDNADIQVYTTRPETLYGATFMVLAPEYENVLDFVREDQKEVVEAYIFKASMKSSVDRLQDKQKTGVFTGSYARNPMTGDKVPIWIADYVLADYGTGAVMCVPAHDQRDYDFASEFDLEIKPVIEGLDKVYSGTGKLINSGIYNGLSSSQAGDQIIDYLESKGLGHKRTNYKLRDWVFSRQRYWGEPIPIIHCPSCGPVPVPEEDLPVKLPQVESYQPTGTGQSPLADMEEWVNTSCPRCGRPSKRETNTMPQWAGSSWYFLRYIDPDNHDRLVDPSKAKDWLPVDMYVGGIEHAVLHLLYARFYTKFLYDIGQIDFVEPFKRLFNQGMINKDGAKMSKSKGNVVSPDDLVREYGCDALRMYELFVGPPELDSEWDDSGIDGVRRFLTRVWQLVIDNKDKAVNETKHHIRLRHQLVGDITKKMDKFMMNTVVSGFMTFNKKLSKLSVEEGLDKKTLETLIILLAPFAPHMAEELWTLMGHQTSVFKEAWPNYDPSKTLEDQISIPIQINGRLRANLFIDADSSKELVIKEAKILVKEKLRGFKIIKEVYVSKKIVNFVIK